MAQQKRLGIRIISITPSKRTREEDSDTADLQVNKREKTSYNSRFTYIAIKKATKACRSIAGGI